MRSAFVKTQWLMVSFMYTMIAARKRYLNINVFNESKLSSQNENQNIKLKVINENELNEIKPCKCVSPTKNKRERENQTSFFCE